MQTYERVKSYGGKGKALPIRPYRGRKYPHPIGGRAQDASIHFNYSSLDKVFKSDGIPRR